MSLACSAGTKGKGDTIAVSDLVGVHGEKRGVGREHGGQAEDVEGWGDGKLMDPGVDRAFPRTVGVKMGGGARWLEEARVLEGSGLVVPLLEEDGVEAWERTQVTRGDFEERIAV